MQTHQTQPPARPAAGNESLTRRAWEIVKARCSELVTPETGAAMAMCSGYSQAADMLPPATARIRPQ